MTKNHRVTAAIVFFSIANLFVSPASARRQTAHAGLAPYSAQSPCFTFDFQSGTAGIALYKTTCPGGPIASYWLMALSLDTSGTKTVQLTLKQTAANQVVCGLVEYNRSGTAVQILEYDPFPATGAYVTVSKSITIATGNNLAALCSFNGAAAGVSNARVLSVEF